MSDEEENGIDMQTSDDGCEPETELRRSSRIVRPSQKVKENYETQFWTLVKDISDTTRHVEKEISAGCPTSIKLQLEREIRHAMEDLDIGYEQLKSTFTEGPPDAARRAADRHNSDLKRLLNRLQQEDVLQTDKVSLKSHSTTSSKRALLAAKAAALQVELEAKRIEGQKKLELAKMEAKERARQDEIQAKERARQDEIQLEIERRRQEIEDQRLEMEIKKAEAEMSVLEMTSVKSLVNNDGHTLHRPVSQLGAVKTEPLVRPVAHCQTLPPTTSELTKAVSETIALSRLPPPEPFVFDGNPMHYPSWKSAFTTLIVNKGILPAERIHYLRKYLTGEAMEAVEGFFDLNTEEAYLTMCNVLEKRFGNPFSITEGYRDKINAWPRIPPGDGKGLRKFADFMRQCVVAMSHIPSLSILDDCRENKNIVSKLPDWLVRRWGRIVTEEMDQGTYPKFARFVDFLDKEAEVMCNPVTASLTDRQGANRAKTPKRMAANTFAVKKQGGILDNSETAMSYNTTNSRTHLIEKTSEPVKAMQPVTTPQITRRVQPTGTTQPFNETRTCMFCERSHHTIDDCWKFRKLTPNDRKEFIMKNGLCFGCLGKGHLSKNCQLKAVCTECGKKHPTSLCGDYAALHEEPAEVSTVDTGRSCRANAEVIGINQTSPSSMIVPVFLSSRERPSEEVLVYALLDTQSDTSFILEDTLQKLQVSTTPTILKLTTMTNTSKIESRKTENLLVRGFQSDKKIVLPTVFSRSFIPSNSDHIPSKEVAKRWPHLNCLTCNIPEKQDCEVGLLIGYDCPQALAPTEVIRGHGNEPFGVKTELGWSVVGRTMSTPESLSHHVLTRPIPDELSINQEQNNQRVIGLVRHTKVREDIPTPEILKVLEADFQERDDGTTMPQEDMKFMKELKQNVHQNSEGYYEMPLPFRNDKPILPESKLMAQRRLDHLRKRLKSNPQYAEDYTQFMNGMIQRGDAEPVPFDEMDLRSWYIPHHGVYHPRKPGKIRVVFDCSAQSRGTSLNDHLLQGPEFMNNLVGVLCRFREKPIAVVGDVEKMFHQFRVDPRDRNYLRFLWWENGDTDKEPTVYRMKVHLFGATSSPGCANFGIKQLATDYKDDYDRVVSDFLMRNVYVDDGLGSFSSEREAISVVRDLRELCSKGNLRLHKFISNSKVVMESIPKSEHAPEMKVELPQESQIGRVLGVEWQVHTDVFQFRLTISQKPATRRGVLATVASVYDPLGFLVPFVLLGKQVLQQMCADGCGWDEELSDELRPKWERWLADLHKLADMKIQRCLVPRNFGKIVKAELHHFSDASFSGYGQCTYLRAINEENQVFCSIVMGKCRVAPLKVVTLPRLELTAAVTSVKISCFLRTEMTFENVVEYFWTDSRIVLGYIQNEARRFHVYVANRIQRIRDSSEPQQWRYVSSHENPADHASRGLTAEELIHSRWLSRTKFLWEPTLSVEEQPYHELSTSDPEVRALVNVTETEESRSIIKKFEKFSDWDQLLSAVGVIKRAIHLKRKLTPTHQEIHREAESKIIRIVQGYEFETEIHAIKTSGALPKGNRLNPLDPFVDKDGILRVGGRIRRSAHSLQLKHPVILPPSSHVTELLIKRCHQDVAHQGRGFTINEIRSKGYWIIRGSRTVSSVIFKCITCRRLRGKNLDQKMSDLPTDRLEEAPPFTHCGLDCFGPFLVKDGRKEVKRYGLIITCMASRAIHIELLDDMTSDTFINGLHCLIAIRGPIKTIRCDQGSNFIGADKELKRAFREMKDDEIKDYLERNNCQFIMNPPHSSHMGGCWERHIRTIRSILATMFHQYKGRLDTSTLRTFMYEVMAIINSRPLSVQDLNDPHMEPLTPNHLLMPLKSKIILTPPGEFTKVDVYARKRWRKVQHLAQEFWNRWRKDYISTLQIRQKWHKNTRNLRKGDIVILGDEEDTRGKWRLGRVVEANPDQDNLVRKVKLVIADRYLSNLGKRLSKPVLLERPIHKLRLLLESEY